MSADPSIEEKPPTMATSFTNSWDIWYPDGSIVLIAEGTAFKVHTSILAQYSEVFRDMFRDGVCSIENAKTDGVQRPTEASYEGCPALSLQDKASDLNHFLKSMYHLSYLERGAKTSFQKVSAILTLSNKYIAPELRKRAFNLISTVYPSTLAEWDEKSTLRLVHPFKSEYLSYLSLAVQTDIPVLLPAIFFDMSKRSSDDVIPALGDIAGLGSWGIVSDYLLGIEKLRNLEVKYLLQFLDLETLALGCGGCEGRLKSVANVAIRKSAATITGMVQKCTIKSSVTDYVQSLQLCKTCVPKVETAIHRGRERIWEELPGIFRMSEWEVLRAEQLSFLEDSSPTAGTRSESPT